MANCSTTYLMLKKMYTSHSHLMHSSENTCGPAWDSRLPSVLKNLCTTLLCPQTGNRMGYVETSILTLIPFICYISVKHISRWNSLLLKRIGKTIWDTSYRNNNHWKDLVISPHSVNFSLFQSIDTLGSNRKRVLMYTFRILCSLSLERKIWATLFAFSLSSCSVLVDFSPFFIMSENQKKNYETF